MVEKGWSDKIIYLPPGIIFKKDTVYVTCLLIPLTLQGYKRFARSKKHRSVLSL